MRPISDQPLPVVTPVVYAAIFRSPQLVRRLFPEELVASPYEILDYQATLFLEDPEGLRATFRRFERIWFLESGVSAILDHFWGDGVTVTHYDRSAGALDDWFRDAGRHHLVVDLGREFGKGEEMAFRVVRTAMAGFAEDLRGSDRGSGGSFSTAAIIARPALQEWGVSASLTENSLIGWSIMEST